MKFAHAFQKYVVGDFFNSFSAYADTLPAYVTARTLVRAYFCFLLFASMTLYVPWNPGVQPEVETVSLWPLFWLPYFEFGSALVAIRLLFVVTSFCAAVAPHHRVLRIASFVGLLEFVSLYISMLQLDVDWYGFLLLSLMLIFLPDTWHSRESSSTFRKNFLFVFWGALAINLLTFTMAGIGKVYSALVQISRGESYFFQPNAAVLHIADRLSITDATSVLGSWAVQHYLLVWPYFLFTLYLLLFSFLIAFRPQAHRLWGALLITYHIGNFLVINIPFSGHILLWAMLLLASPFVPEKTSIRDAISRLPLVDLILRRFQRT